MKLLLLASFLVSWAACSSKAKSSRYDTSSPDKLLSKIKKSNDGRFSKALHIVQDRAASPVDVSAAIESFTDASRADRELLADLCSRTPSPSSPFAPSDASRVTWLAYLDEQKKTLTLRVASLSSHAVASLSEVEREALEISSEFFSWRISSLDRLVENLQWLVDSVLMAPPLQHARDLQQLLGPARNLLKNSERLRDRISVERKKAQCALNFESLSAVAENNRLTKEFASLIRKLLISILTESAEASLVALSETLEERPSELTWRRLQELDEQFTQEIKLIGERMDKSQMGKAGLRFIHSKGRLRIRLATWKYLGKSARLAASVERNISALIESLAEISVSEEDLVRTLLTELENVAELGISTLLELLTNFCRIYAHDADKGKSVFNLIHHLHARAKLNLEQWIEEEQIIAGIYFHNKTKDSVIRLVAPRSRAAQALLTPLSEAKIARLEAQDVASDGNFSPEQKAVKLQALVEKVSAAKARLGSIDFLGGHIDINALEEYKSQALTLLSQDLEVISSLKSTIGK